jgi:hypothetical protein
MTIQIKGDEFQNNYLTKYVNISEDVIAYISLTA